MVPAAVLDNAITDLLPLLKPAGHYAQAADVTSYPPVDITIEERIGDLLNYGLPALLDAALTKDTR